MTKAQLEKIRKRLIALATNEARRITETMDAEFGWWHCNAYSSNDLTCRNPIVKVYRMYRPTERVKVQNGMTFRKPGKIYLHKTWVGFREKWLAIGLDVETLKITPELIGQMDEANNETSDLAKLL